MKEGRKQPKEGGKWRRRRNRKNEGREGRRESEKTAVVVVRWEEGETEEREGGARVARTERPTDAGGGSIDGRGLGLSEDDERLGRLPPQPPPPPP